MIDSAVILAAGMGTRLRDTIGNIPKGFVNINGIPIIERSILQLLSVGIANIVIVTGYLSKYYDALSEKYSSVKTIRNTLYADSESMYSLYCAREFIRDHFLLLESDLVYETLALNTVISFQKGNCILVAGFSNAGDEVYVGADGCRVHGISKQKSTVQNIIGELVGISKISPEMYQTMIAYSEKYFRKNLKLDYESCISEIAKKINVFYCKLNDLLWAEVDDRSHLIRANRIAAAMRKKETKDRE